MRKEKVCAYLSYPFIYIKKYNFGLINQIFCWVRVKHVFSICALLLCYKKAFISVTAKFKRNKSESGKNKDEQVIYLNHFALNLDMN